MAELENRETMWAEMKPDVYDGPSCAEHRPCWHGYADGDKEGSGPMSDCLNLDANRFPPGTRVTISEPVCPKCGEVPSEAMEPVEITTDDGEKFMAKQWKCGCDFDWRSWTIDQYA